MQGGISNGEDIYFRVAFKPPATIALEQKTVTTSNEQTELAARGRHDPCVLPRAVPIVEAMAALVLCDHALRQNAISIADSPIADCAIDQLGNSGAIHAFVCHVERSETSLAMFLCYLSRQK